MRVPRLPCVALRIAATLAGSGHAAHPLISEDTGTQGRGKFELELGSTITHGQGGRIVELDPQLSYGAFGALDVILRPSVFWLTGGAAEGAGRSPGFGATSLDVKWRPLTWGAWSVGTRAGVDLPTASEGIGPRQPGTHALVMATYASDAMMGTAILAYGRVPRDPTTPGARRDMLRGSLATLVKLTSSFRLGADIAIMRAEEVPQRAWPAVAVLGVIARLPGGVDADTGYQQPRIRPAPAGAWLLGATLRW